MERPVKHGSAGNRDALGRLLPGYTLNPFGRPKVGTSLAEILRQAGEQCLEDGRTYNQALCDRLWNIALTEPSAEHATTAIRYLFNRLLGTPVETVQQTTLNISIEQVVMLLQSAGPMLSVPGEVLALGETDSDDEDKEANGKDLT